VEGQSVAETKRPKDDVARTAASGLEDAKTRFIAVITATITPVISARTAGSFKEVTVEFSKELWRLIKWHTY